MRLPRLPSPPAEGARHYSLPATAGQLCALCQDAAINPSCRRSTLLYQRLSRCLAARLPVPQDAALPNSSSPSSSATLPDSESSPYLEPFLRTFVLGVGAGIMLEAAHVAAQVGGRVGGWVGRWVK